MYDTINAHLFMNPIWFLRALLELTFMLVLGVIVTIELGRC